MGQNLSVALLYAAAAGDVPEIRTLHERGADINAIDQDSRWTPIHYAAWGGHAAAVRELLVRGADVNARDLDLKTPLHYATLGGHAEAVEALCNHAALVNAADADGSTPLHKAAVQGQLALVQELLARGANPDARLKDGSTPAHLAAWRGHRAALGCLLQNGGDAGAATAGGDTPLHEAAKGGHEACCRLLLTHGASRAALDAAGNTPSDAALLADLVRVAELVRPAPGEVEAARRLRQPAPGASSGEACAQPSAPAWADGPISYPVIDNAARQQPATQASVLRPSQQRPQQRLLQAEAAKGRQAAAEASDWEPQPEQDWEAVSPQGPAPGRGAQLMAAYSDQEGPAAAGQGDRLWMVPGPVKWAAASVGGRLAGLLPWRRTAEAAQPQAAEAADAAAEPTEEGEPPAGAGPQAARLSKQEAEIAQLRRQLAVAARGTEGGEGPGERLVGGAYPALSSIAGGKAVEAGGEAQQRGRAAAERAGPCREVAPEELHAATDGFAAANRLSSDAAGSSFAGTLGGEAVTVWVPAQQGALPWRALQPGADRLAALRAPRLVRVRAACRDGSLVLDHLANGSLEDALRSHAPRRGRAPVRLAWPARAAAAAHAAEGLAALHAAAPPLPHGALRPAAVLLSEAREAALRPPSLPALALGPQAEGLSAATAPEVRRGGPPTRQADVWSLGLLLLQLLTGAEPSGLLDYVRSAVAQGRIGDVLDPCSEGASPATALPLARLALRCAEERPEDRPDLRTEVLPELQRLAQAAAEAAAAGEQPGAAAAAEEPPAHLVCPITQEVVVKPVIAADGYTYEEAAIRQWLQNGRQVSPMTNAPLPHADLTPNFVIQSAASTWREQHAAPPPAAQPLQARVAELNRRLAAAPPPGAAPGDVTAPGGAAGEPQGERDVLADLPDVPRTRVPAAGGREAARPRRAALAE